MNQQDKLNMHTKPLLIFFLFLLSFSQAQLLIISNPAAPILESDPAVGQVLETNADLSSATPRFIFENRQLEYLRTLNDLLIVSFDDGASQPGSGGMLFSELNAEETLPTYELLTGESTELIAPKDFLVLPELNMLFITDFGDGTIKVFNSDDRNNTKPSFVISDLGKSERLPWGAAIDEETHSLFVVTTDGFIVIYDDVILNQGRNGPDRIIQPEFAGETASNLHSIIYLKESDRLIMSDFGASVRSNEENFNTDGKLFVLDNASTADGLVTASTVIEGPNTFLGNPAGITLLNNNLYVAEKSNDLILRFDNITELTGSQNLAPSAAISVLKPEAVLHLP